MGSTLYNFCLQLSISFHFSQVCWMALVMTAAQQVDMMIMSSRFGKSWRNKPNILKGPKRDPLLSTCKQLKSSWWFQPIWKNIIVKLDHLPGGGKSIWKKMNKKHHPEVVTIPGRRAGSWPGKKLENCKSLTSAEMKILNPSKAVCSWCVYHQPCESQMVFRMYGSKTATVHYI